MKTHLIVLTSLDELRAKKEALVQKFSDNGNLKKYGDDSVETNDDEIFFLKVITSSEYRAKLMQTIGRGYDYAELSSVIKEVEELLDTILSIKREFVDKELRKLPPGSLKGGVSSDDDQPVVGGAGAGGDQPVDVATGESDAIEEEEEEEIN